MFFKKEPIKKFNLTLSKIFTYFVIQSTFKNEFQTQKRRFMIAQNKRFIAIMLTVTFLLLVPLIAMQFTQEVNWTLSDFAAAASLLLVTGIVCEFVMRRVKKVQYRIAICVAILAIFFLVWIELAVGIFGTPLAGQ